MEEDRDSRLKTRAARLKELNPTYEELLFRVADSEDWAAFLEDVNERQKQLIAKCEGWFDWISDQLVKHKGLDEIKDLEAKVIAAQRFYEGALAGRDAQKKIGARNAANTRHSKVGGSREKAQQIRTIWASGKYSSRDLCAEQECAALGMSFSAARKALRNTPDP